MVSSSVRSLQLFSLDNEGKFLKKLWYCVGGEYLTIIRRRRGEYCRIIDNIIRQYFTEPEANNCFSIISKLNNRDYYHLRSTVKREHFFAHAYFSNETVPQTTVSTGPMKMFRLEHETMNVCQRNVTRFGHVECRFSRKGQRTSQKYRNLVGSDQQMQRLEKTELRKADRTVVS